MSSNDRSTGFWPTKGRKRKVAKQTTPWAESKQRKIDTREKKMLKKEKKYMKEKEGKIKKKRRKKQKFTKDEIDELARDIALMKKLKHKKVRIISSIVKYVAGYSYRILSDENTLMCVQIYKYRNSSFFYPYLKAAFNSFNTYFSLIIFN